MGYFNFFFEPLVTMSDDNKIAKDAWRRYEPLGIEGAEMIENETLQCVNKVKEAELESKKCQEAVDAKDLKTAMVHAKKVKLLSDDIKKLKESVEKRAALIRQEHGESSQN